MGPKPKYDEKKNTLPAPVRGQQTFGYSWIAYTTAATLAGCRELPFALDDIESIAESGKELLSGKTLSWKRNPNVFLEDLDKWLIYKQVFSIRVRIVQTVAYHDRPNFHQEDQSHLQAPARLGDNGWYSHVLGNIIFERTHDRMLMWKEIHFLVRRLRLLGFPKDGIRADKAISRNLKMDRAWQQLRVLIRPLIMSVTWDLQDAYAWSEGSELVEREFVSLSTALGAAIASARSSARSVTPTGATLTVHLSHGGPRSRWQSSSQRITSPASLHDTV